jgi:hypothetical protein
MQSYWNIKTLCNELDAEIISDHTEDYTTVYCVGIRNDRSAGIRSVRFTEWFFSLWELDVFIRDNYEEIIRKAGA